MNKYEALKIIPLLAKYKKMPINKIKRFKKSKKEKNEMCVNN
jgi:hypothetical protein